MDYTLQRRQGTAPLKQEYYCDEYAAGCKKKPKDECSHDFVGPGMVPFTFYLFAAKLSFFRNVHCTVSDFASVGSGQACGPDNPCVPCRDYPYV